MDFLITNLGGEAVILGLPWLCKVNPTIDWQKGWVHVPSEEQKKEFKNTDRTEIPETTIAQEAPIRILGNRARRRAWMHTRFIETLSDTLWCGAGYTYSQKIAEEANKKKPLKNIEEIIPEHY